MVATYKGPLVHPFPMPTGEMASADAEDGESGLMTAKEPSVRSAAINVLPSGVRARPANFFWEPLAGGWNGVRKRFEVVEKTSMWSPAEIRIYSLIHHARHSGIGAYLVPADSALWFAPAGNGNGRRKVWRKS